MLVLALSLGLVRLWLGLAWLGLECVVAGIALSMGTPPAPDLDDGA